jgi:hypothetical protein
LGLGQLQRGDAPVTSAATFVPLSFCIRSSATFPQPLTRAQRFFCSLEFLARGLHELLELPAGTNSRAGA